MKFLKTFIVSFFLLFGCSFAITYDQLMFSPNPGDLIDDGAITEREYISDNLGDIRSIESAFGGEDVQISWLGELKELLQIVNLEDLFFTVCRLKKERDDAYSIIDKMLLRLEDVTDMTSGEE